MTTRKPTRPMPDKEAEFGEGNYKAGRQFRRAQHEFAQQGPVKEKAREAAKALDGPDNKELERARRAAKDGKTAR